MRALERHASPRRPEVFERPTGERLQMLGKEVEKTAQDERLVIGIHLGWGRDGGSGRAAAQRYDE
ncbi:hypothetical protein CHIBA101_0135 [Actinomyces sp. Chiba101]|nr:hypothetical protein CHIBA101_0135 [Actinomyces sp. Chiba101]GAV95058.1 hypothetical protein ADENT20671_1836 [Actinomyces denticolens]